jgi:osmotically-inducible protein OsmY
MSYPESSETTVGLLSSSCWTEIRRKAEYLLERSRHPELRRVCCDVQQGVLRLRGLLPSHFLKQMAQVEVAAIEGVRALINDIEVSNPDRHREFGFDLSGDLLERCSYAEWTHSRNNEDDG